MRDEIQKYNLDVISRYTTKKTRNVAFVTFLFISQQTLHLKYVILQYIHTIRGYNANIFIGNVIIDTVLFNSGFRTRF